MTEHYEIVQAETVRLGTLQVQGPHEVVSQASIIAGELANVINSQKLYSNISGKKYVRVEGWNTLGAMLGILPREVSVTETESGDFEAVVELVRATDGEIIGRGSAILGSDEPTWAKRPRYARRSMAITRATGKAFRLGFSWIMALAGYEVTPAEEIIEGEVVEAPKAQSKDKPTPEPTNGNGSADDRYYAVVNAGLSENFHAAKQALNKCKTGYDTDEKAIAWMKLYRGWRDLGADSDKAAKFANEGEEPH